MSVKHFKYILVITNLLIILLSIAGIVLSYFLVVPRLLSDDLDNEAKLQTFAFSCWGLVLSLTAICFIGIAFTRSIFLHLIAALLLCCPLALGVWLIVEQFLFRENANWLVSGIAFTASLLWTVQIFTELLLACCLCCGHTKSASITKDLADAELGAAPKDKDTDGIQLNIKDGLDGKRNDEHESGTDEEKERLVLISEKIELQQAFVPSPQAPPIQEVDEDVDEEDDEEDEVDSQARSPVPPPQELQLHSIAEERQQLLPNVGTIGHDGRPCPLATPEDTGV